MTQSPNNESENEIKTSGNGQAQNSSLNYIGFENIKTESKTAEHRDMIRKARQHKKKKTRIILTIAIILAALIIAVMIVLFILIAVGKNQMLKNNISAINIPKINDVAPESDGKTLTYKGKKYVFNENVTSILCMGIDKEELQTSESYGGNGQADANVLLAIDTKTGKMNAISISRDTMIDANVYSEGGSFVGAKKEQLCLGYANGDGKKRSCQNMVKSVSSLFYGIPINSYMAIELRAIGLLNNAVGGVTVTAPESYTFRTTTFNEGQSYNLDTNEKATAFVRYRNTAVLDSNLNRMNRQKIYLKAFAKSAIAKTKQDIRFPLSLYGVVKDYNENNMNTAKISFLTSCVIGNMKTVDLNFLNVEGTVTKGEKYAEFTPDKDKLFELILKVYYTEQK